jgi:hypothetical protein
MLMHERFRRLALAGDFEKLRSRLGAAQEPSVSSMTNRPAANVMPGASQSTE